MKSDRVRTFATFRIVGDRLEPDQITNFLKIRPTQAYAKGEQYTAGPRSANLLGRTGVWYLSTDQFVASSDLNDHLNYLLRALQLGGRRSDRATDGAQLTANLLDLRRLMDEKALRAVVTCFWYGPAGVRKPSIPRGTAEVFNLIDADIETDFDADESPIGGTAMAG
jgi:hypothetical protein